MLGACLAAAWLTACGDEAPPELAPVAEPSPRVTDIDPSQREQDVDVSDGNEEADVGSLSRSDAYADFLAALDRELRARCNCLFSELGHDSPEVCFESRREPAIAISCELSVFPRFEQDLAPRYACLAQARDTSARCIEDGGCMALPECEATRDVARSGCGALNYAEVGFANLSDSCQRTARLGMVSGCPDLPSLGSALGAKVMEGDSTGAGDDISLSCHWDFDGFEAADVMVEWQAPAAGTYRFGTENSDFSTQLGILDGCGGAELACSSPGGAMFGSAEVTLTLEALQSVLVVIEGYHLVQTGYYALSVTQVE